jgi:uncharacterized protein
MKSIFVALFLLIGGWALAQRDYPGTIAHIQNLYNQGKGDSIYALFSDKMKGMMTQESAKKTFDGVMAQFGPLKSYSLLKADTQYCTYTAEFEKQTLGMVLGLNALNQVEGLRFYPLPTVSRDTSRYASDYNLVTASGILYGTLTDPMARGKVPVVFIIAGSGPTDRDGNSYGVTTNMYRQLADSLRKYQIATVRYDKRGVGASSQSLKSVVDLTFNDYVQDAAAYIRKLKADNSFSEVIVLGHSEGSLIGLLASLQEHPAAYISLAGAGEPIDKIILRQMAAQDSNWKRYMPIVDSLKNGLQVTEPDNDNGLFRKSMQPYWISWIKYDPAKEISQLHIPALILQGTTDLQVRVEDAQELSKAKPDATMTLIVGMNHILKTAPVERQANLATYNDPGLPLAPALVQAIVSFVHGVK